jgi:hypothetical protein
MRENLDISRVLQFFYVFYIRFINRRGVLFGLAADAVMQKEKTVIQEIKVNPVYCFNKPSEKLIIRPDFIGCIIGEDEPLGQTELKKEQNVRRNCIHNYLHVF